MRARLTGGGADPPPDMSDLDPGRDRPSVGAHLKSFHELMRNRVSRILLVSSLYDSFIMSEEGHLQETLLSQFLDLNLANIPDLVHVESAEEAVELLVREPDFELVVSSIQTGDGDAGALAKRLREEGISARVVALAYTNRELADFLENENRGELDGIFLWQGDTRILVAIVKYVEDRLNAENDTGLGGVPAIIVVEDNIRFYSSFLPAIYSELLRHTHALLSEDLNLSQKMMRMRARPKVLLCDNYEDAWDWFDRFSEHVLGIVSDFEYPREGKLDPRAGLDLCSRAVERHSDIRLVLQSSKPKNRELAEEIGASFLLKGSATLLQDLRKLLVDRFGFGDFVFRGAGRKVVDRATDLSSFAEKLAEVPPECVVYHAERNHFSNWLKARTEFAIAERLRPRKLAEFESVEHMRAHLLGEINEYRHERLRTVISDFERKRFEPEATITRIGAGSLGGKARGVAFANRILLGSGVDEMFPDVDIRVPSSVVVGTQVFDQFLEYGEIRDIAIASDSDELIEDSFVSAPFPRPTVGNLRSLVQRVKYPLAVRSSSLLEDSLSQPFAGVYRTFMLPNNDPEIDVRWRQLVNAVKRVYASAFTQRAKAYLSMTSFRLEEEKMAVMVQQLVGNQHKDRFYPDFAGVARSHNFYPEPGHAAEDGVVAVALGLGRTVVDGSPCLRFNPKYPQQIVSFSSVADALKSSQRDFFGVDLIRETYDGIVGMRRYPLELAEEDGALKYLGSTYSHADDRIVDGISRDGVRLVSFAQVLKHDAFPLAKIIQVLLDRCAEGTGGPVEIEFAGNLASATRKRSQFAFLQLRPLALSKEQEAVEIGDWRDEELLCRTPRVLGNGRIDDIADVVVVDIETFERQKSPEVAREVARFDALLRKEGRPYLLIGVGRWGSADPSLGIPVAWNQIAGARAIVEAGFKDIKVAPSQGTHFFQNLTSCSVGYFTVNPDVGEGHVDWEWLAGLKSVDSTEYVRHLRLEKPLLVVMSGRTGEGVIVKPRSALTLR